MPKVYRVMIEADGRPACGNQRDMLGVREGARPQGDITIIDGTVEPGSEGMSVNICPYQMPPFIIPVHLNQRNGPFEGAKGKPGRRIWSTGDGPFVQSSLTDALTLMPDSAYQGVAPDHGCVAPAVTMTIEKYQESLSSTQNTWRIDEQKNDDCPICRKNGVL